MHTLEPGAFYGFKIYHQCAGLCTKLMQGLPPKLSLPKEDTQLRPDSVESQQAGYENRLPLLPYRFEALYTALRLMQPSLSVFNFDVVTGLNNIRQILRFCQKGETGRRNFRIDLELIKTTLFMSRWDNYATDDASLRLNPEKRRTSNPHSTQCPRCGYQEQFSWL